MGYLKKEEGFTLVEIIIALTILFIVIISFTILFTTGFSGIFGAGRKSEALYKAQEEMDNTIIRGAENLASEPLNIKFDNINIDVSGEEIEVYYEYEGRTGVLHYFVPEGN